MKKFFWSPFWTKNYFGNFGLLCVSVLCGVCSCLFTKKTSNFQFVFWNTQTISNYNFKGENLDFTLWLTYIVLKILIIYIFIISSSKPVRLFSLYFMASRRLVHYYLLQSSQTDLLSFYFGLLGQSHVLFIIYNLFKQTVWIHFFLGLLGQLHVLFINLQPI